MVTSYLTKIPSWETTIRHVFIYNGDGCYGENPSRLKRLFTMLEMPWTISMIAKEQVTPDYWDRKSTLFVLPGGVASEYDIALSHRVQEVQRFVKEGGRYMGICGGAYFSSARSIYKIRENECIDRKRSLSFFDGTAVGPLFFSNSNKASFQHAAVKINFPSTKQSGYALVSGGGTYIPHQNKKRYSVLAYYDDLSAVAEYTPQNTHPLPSRLPAVVMNYFGKGKALLSSVHFECGANDIDLPTYQKYFPSHPWDKIVANLKDADFFRTQAFTDMLRAF